MGATERNNAKTSASSRADNRPLLKRRLFARALSPTKANLCRFALALPFGIIAVIAIVLHGLLPPMILDSIGDSLNADVTAESWDIGLDEVVLHGVTVRSRSLEGRPGEILTITKLTAGMDPSQLFGGASAVTTLVLEQPTLRLSVDTQSVDRPRTNLIGLTLPETDGPGPAGEFGLPAIEVSGGAIDWGEHTGSSFHSLRVLRVDGTLRPLPDADEPTLELALYEVLSASARRDENAPKGFVLTGEIAPERVNATLRDFDVRSWLPSAAPTSIRPLLADLAIEGSVSEIGFSLEGAELERVSAVAQLDDVAVTLPLSQDDDPGEGLRLSRSSGSLRIEQRQLVANLRGDLADVPLAVDFQADVSDLLEGRGAESNMPYTARIVIDKFIFGQQSRVLPFLPADTREVLARFANQNQIGAISPTAEVAAEVNLSGRLAGGAGGFGSAVLQTYRGIVRIDGGATAFHEFPYQFEHVTGTIEFNQDRLIIRSLSGVAESGAVLSASGLVTPLGAAAGFDLEVEVFDMPIDRALRAAMKPEHRSGLDQILNAPQYAELVARALVVPPGEREAVLGAIEDARRQVEMLDALGDPAAETTLGEIDRMARRAASAPEIDMGGMLGMVLKLTKPAGGGGRWDTVIQADVANATLIPEQFPLPIRVRDMAVVIDEDVVTVTRASAVPVNALSGTIEGTIDVSGPKSRPELSFRADRLRTGELLRYAIGPAGRDPARLVASQVVADLGLYGDTDAVGRLTADEAGETEFAVEMGLDRIGLLTDSLPGRPPLVLGDATGVLNVTHHGLRLDTDALYTGLSGDEGIDSPATVQVALDLDWSDQDRDLVTAAAIGAQGVPVSAPVEQIVTVFSPEAANGIMAMRDAFDPTGTGDAEVRINADGSGTSTTTAELMGLRDISVAQFGGRIEFDRPEGRVVVHGRRDGRAHLELRDVEADLRFGGEPAGSFIAEGTLELSPPDGAARRNRELNVSYTGGRFESELARSFVTTQLGGRFAEDFVSHDARGEFDLKAHIVPLTTEPDAAARPGLEQIARPTYTLLPRWGEILRRGRDVRVDITEGAIVTALGKTRIEGLRGDGNGFSVAADGSITPDGFGGASIDVAVGVQAAELTPDLRALLIDEIDANIEKLAFESPGRISLQEGRLRAATGAGGGSSFQGVLTFENASMMLGSPVDQIAGTVRVESARKADDEAPDLLLLAFADRARLSGIELRDARVRVEGEADRPGWLDVPVFSAAGRQGGRIWGRGTLTPTDDPEVPAYEFGASFTGLSLAGVQNELQAFGEQLPSADDLQSPRPDTGARVQGRLSLAGLVQRDETRRGRMSMRIAGGELLRVPLLGRLIEVKALQPPTGESIDFAEADLTVSGTTVTADYISVQSRTVEVFGSGLITLPDFDLDLVLYTRSISPWPIVSRFADALFDEFGKVSITGTAKEPRVSILAFPSSRRLLGSILAAGAPDGSTRLDAVQRRAFQLREGRDRYRQVQTPARPAKISTRPNGKGAAGQAGRPPDSDGRVADLQEQQ